MNVVLIDGKTTFNSVSQIFNSNVLNDLICEMIEFSERKRTSLLNFFNLFIKDIGSANTNERYDVKGIIMLLQSLVVSTVETIDSSPYLSFPKLSDKKDLLITFVERLYSLWRSKHRFLIRDDEITEDLSKRVFKQLLFQNNNEQLKLLIRNTYRQILINISNFRMKILRQTHSGAQAGFMIDKVVPLKEAVPSNGNILYDLNVVWSIIFDPPAIFYTRSNKRRGIFKVVNRPILSKIKIKNKEDWFLFPVMVGSKMIFVVVYKDYLSLGAGLANLFEFVDLAVVKSKKPDGVYFLGIEKSFFDEDDDYNGIVYRENDGTYVGLVGDDPSVDYFGYMKKMILTIHNLLIIDENRLPIHGSLARIRLKNGKEANVMLVGDSGAGKSETLDAFERLKEDVSEVDILIDDMGSLAIDGDRVVAYGTETGAFVRLDDLEPGYAYSAMDRSIFMNPNEINARVIVPYSNYKDIILPTKVDYFLYANNYEKPINDSIAFFKSSDEALKVFSEGARMAKGTTSETGLTYSYFANPFGAIQKKEKHTKIAEKFMQTMLKGKTKIGMIKTQLGINGFEKEGPLLAAKSLLHMIDKEE